MNGAQSLGNPTFAAGSHAAQPSVEELEDVLYDILAAGVDPGEPGTLEAVQLLLHAHARSRKSAGELLGFFEMHGIAFARESARPAPMPFALPNVESLLPAAAISGTPSQAHMQAPVHSQRVRSVLMWAAAAGTLLFVSAGLAAAYTTVTGMRQEIARVQSESAQQAAALAHVKAEAETLRAGINESTTLMRRVDQKSELLLQTLVSPLDPAAR